MSLHRSVGLVVALLPTLACGGLSSANTEPVTPGTFVLQAVNGQPPPADWVVLDANNKVEFFSGSITLNTDDSFTDVTTYRVTQGGVVTLEDDSATGVWSQSGRNITFSPTGAESYTLIWDGINRLTQILQGVTLTYVK